MRREDRITYLQGIGGLQPCLALKLLPSSLKKYQSKSLVLFGTFSEM